MAVQHAPDFTLQHIQGHEVRLSDFRGRKVVVMFTGKDSADQAKQSTAAIRDRYGEEELPLLTVIDVSKLPKLLHRVAAQLLKKGYGDAVESARAGYAATGRPFPTDPSTVVVMLPDYDGSVTRSFGAGDVNSSAHAVLVDEEGLVVGTGSGPDAGRQILAHLP
jgi:hypothetical protein